MFWLHINVIILFVLINVITRNKNTKKKIFFFFKCKMRTGELVANKRVMKLNIFPCFMAKMRFLVIDKNRRGRSEWDWSKACFFQ
jgi:hypothetical protein